MTVAPPIGPWQYVKGLMAPGNQIDDAFYERALYTRRAAGGVTGRPEDFNEQITKQLVRGGGRAAAEALARPPCGLASTVRDTGVVSSS
jgi:hypothetical protein